MQVIECKFENVMNFSDGMVAFSNDTTLPKKWGFIDRQGNVICEPQFAEPMFFKNGLAKVTFPMDRVTAVSYQGYVNKKGEIVFKDDKDHCIEVKKHAAK